MSAKKKIDVYQENDLLEITVKWFSPKAYFLLFFSLFWWGFLFFWYTMAIGGGAPLVFILFPLLHVAAGLYMLYYTVCLFMNKTYLDIFKDYLSITHKPIPWWRGNKDIAIEDIRQIYVKEKVTRGKNGSSISYELRMQTKKGEDESLFAIDTLESHQLLQIEEYLENFIGIEDAPVAGEFGKDTIRQRPTSKQARKQYRQFSDSPFSPVYFARKNDQLRIKDQSVSLVNEIQYDWKDGNSDKQWQGLDEINEEQLFYLKQNGALLTAYQEKALSLADSQALLFDVRQPATSLLYQGNAFQMDQYLSGHAFVNNTSIELEQWWYTSANGEEVLRIVNQDGMMRFFHGEKMKAADVNHTLDLNQLPEREVRHEDGSRWDEEDLV